jgi:hypothetical protein
MAIAEAQLDIWAKQGSISQSRSTYAMMRAVLEGSHAAYASRGFDIFLQGSYGNDTNIYADSDVDVVIRLNDVFYHDIGALNAAEQAIFHSVMSSGSYGFSDFRRDVLARLHEAFGTAVRPGTKAILIDANNTRRSTDVLVAAKWRHYTRFKSLDDETYAEGLVFWGADGDRIVNYPKQHAANCTAKHQATNGWFKPAVRILKNMRNSMSAKGLIAGGLAPSYFLEGALYNVPDHLFGQTYQSTIANALNWLVASARPTLLCANEMYYLLNATSPVTWRAEQFETYLRQTIAFWNSQ